MMSNAWRAGLDGRLAQQLGFLLEADRLKSVVRGSRIADGSRRENTAEHSWHLALFALVLREWAVGEVDAWRLARMLVLHHLLEIACGDPPLFDAAGADAALAASLFHFGELDIGGLKLELAARGIPVRPLVASSYGTR